MKKGRRTREIAKVVRISPRDIGSILKEYYKEPQPEPPKSKRAKAFQMFSEGKNIIEVSIALDLSYDEAIQYI